MRVDAAEELTPERARRERARRDQRARQRAPDARAHLGAVGLERHARERERERVGEQRGDEDRVLAPQHLEGEADRDRSDGGAGRDGDEPALLRWCDGGAREEESGG